MAPAGNSPDILDPVKIKLHYFHYNGWGIREWGELRDPSACVTRSMHEQNAFDTVQAHEMHVERDAGRILFS